MSDPINTFSEKFRARATVTDQYMINRITNITQVGNIFASPYPYGNTESAEKVVRIDLPESDFYKLCQLIHEHETDMNLTLKDERLYKLYMEYKLWLQMIK